MAPDSRGIRRLLLRHTLPVLLFVLMAIGLLPATSFADEGFATWYGQPFHGRHMANGQIYDMSDPTTTASNMYPFGTWVKVTNPANGRSVVVQVRDRGGFTHALDLSYAAFASIEDPARMKIRVLYDVVGGPDAAPAPPRPSPAPVPAPAPAPAPQPAKTVVPDDYTVVAGDSLIAISRRFGLEAVTLAKWNSLSDANVIAIGQHLRLTGSNATESTPSSRGASPAVVDNTLSSYTIVAGDTVWGISKRYGTTPARLSELNNLGDEDVIVVGHILRVPAATSATPIVAPSAPAPAATSNSNTVSVKFGDTLFSIALRHDVTVAALVSANGLADPNLLQPGQVLRLP